MVSCRFWASETKDCRIQKTRIAKIEADITENESNSPPNLQKFADRTENRNVGRGEETKISPDLTPRRPSAWRRPRGRRARSPPATGSGAPAFAKRIGANGLGILQAVAIYRFVERFFGPPGEISEN